MLLDITDLLEPTSAHLDQYAITVGSIRISVYTVLKAVVVLSVVFWLSGALSRGTKAYLRRVGLKSRTRALMTKFFDIILYSIVFFIILNVVGVDLTALAVIGGAVGVGVGFGLQKITSNFISGIILIFERSIDTHDLVELEGNVYGWIRYLGARYTLVETLDGKEIMIPNEDFITGRVVNWTFTNAQARINIPVGVSYQSDIKLAKDLMIAAANEYEHTLNTPPPVCHLREFGDSSVNFELRFWLKDIRKTKGPYEPQSAVMFAIWDKFKEHNIEIPFPQRDVHIKDAGTLSVRLEKNV